MTSTPPARRPRTTYAASAVVALVSVVSLAACGGDAPSAGPGDGRTDEPSSTPTASPPAERAEQAEQAETTPGGASTTAAPEEEGGVTPIDAAAFADVVETGLDPAQGADLSVDSGLGLLGGEGRIDFRQDPAALALTLTSSETGDGQPIDLLVVGEVLYLADGARFLGVGVESTGNPFGASLTDQLDPRIVLAAVQRSLRSAQERGTVEQGGEQLTVYRAVADGPAVLASIAPELADQPDTVVPEEVTADIHVDADGLARRIRVDLGAENGALSYALDGWSTEVAVTAPPASQVEDLRLPG